MAVPDHKGDPMRWLTEWFSKDLGETRAEEAWSNNFPRGGVGNCFDLAERILCTAGKPVYGVAVIANQSLCLTSRNGSNGEYKLSFAAVLVNVHSDGCQ